MNDAAPGKYGAILKLPDGTEIELDEKKDGAIAENVTKDGSKLVYDAKTNGSHRHIT